MIRFAALLIRGVAATFVGLLVAGGTLTLAADRVAPQRPTLVPVSAGPKSLVVPQVTGQAYVFAKGILQDGGFAWRVSGSVKGYAGNTVAAQEPVAGSVVQDTGAPRITLTLSRKRITRSGVSPTTARPMPAPRSCCRAISPRREPSRGPGPSFAPGRWPSPSERSRCCPGSRSGAS